MDKEKWISLFSSAFVAMGERLEQVLQLSKCREHWIQAEVSLHAWFTEGIDVWTERDIGNNRTADLYADDDTGATTMIAELKCLGDLSESKCLSGRWSVRNDVDRLRSFDCPTRLFVLVIAKGPRETNTGRRLREEAWVDGIESVQVDLGHALIRIWAV